MNYWDMKRIGIIVLAFIFLILPVGIVSAQSAAKTRVGFFEAVETKPGSRVEVPVQIEDVQDLYGIDIEIKFDPEVIKIEDADPETEGTQPALGTFLDAGLTLFNTVDNEAGVIRFVMSQMRPSEPKSGDGIILVLYVQGLAKGESLLEITNLQLSTRAGEAIAAQPVDGKVTVSDEAASQESTSIPVQDPTSIVIVPTSQPTEIPDHTPTPTKTDTPLPEETESSESLESTTAAGLSSTTTPTAHAISQVNNADSQPTHEPNESVTEESLQENKTLLDYWWIVLIVVLAAVGLAAYLFLGKK